jgi:hypothetical protein
VTASCKRGNETSVSVKCGDFIDWEPFTKTDFAPWSKEVPKSHCIIEEYNFSRKALIFHAEHLSAQKKKVGNLTCKLEHTAPPMPLICLGVKWRLKADSRSMLRPCRAHAVPLPCCAAKSLECVLFYSHSVAVSDSHLPCCVHDLLRPRRSSQCHGTGRPSRDGLWATGSLSASSGYHAEFHKGFYQKHTNLRFRWPVWNQKFVKDEEKSGSSTLQEKTPC